MGYTRGSDMFFNNVGKFFVCFFMFYYLWQTSPTSACTPAHGTRHTVTALSTVGFADKEASLSPPAFTQFFQTILASGRCQLTRFGLLPSYVVDGSSPKQPWKGGSRGSG